MKVRLYGETSTRKNCEIISSRAGATERNLKFGFNMARPSMPSIPKSYLVFFKKMRIAPTDAQGFAIAVNVYGVRSVQIAGDAFNCREADEA